jgi:NADPH:quinone reductase-like Zn-dependent oxidoreductase
MKAVVTQVMGGTDQLMYADVPLPWRVPGEAPLKVLAAGVENTAIDTWQGWCRAPVTTGSVDASEGALSMAAGMQTRLFKSCRGTGSCCELATLEAGVPQPAPSSPVSARPPIQQKAFDDLQNIWHGSDVDGALAEFVKSLACKVVAVDYDLSDALPSHIPCAHGTAESMIERVGVDRAARVPIAGASGRVRSAAVQLARRRGAEVVAITSTTKQKTVARLGATRVRIREADLLAEVLPEAVDMEVDNIAGEVFGTPIELAPAARALCALGYHHQAASVVAARSARNF